MFFVELLITILCSFVGLYSIMFKANNRCCVNDFCSPNLTDFCWPQNKGRDFHPKKSPTDRWLKSQEIP